jgi:hypothetical protein
VAGIVIEREVLGNSKGLQISLNFHGSRNFLGKYDILTPGQADVQCRAIIQRRSSCLLPW